MEFMTERKSIKGTNATYIDLPENLKREVKAKASLRGETFRDAVITALAQWLKWGIIQADPASTDIGKRPDTVPPGTAIASIPHGNPAEVARRAARVVTLLEEAKALVEEAARADTGGEARGPKHTPRKRAGGSQ